MGLSELIVAVHFMRNLAKSFKGILYNWMEFYALLNSVESLYKAVKTIYQSLATHKNNWGQL